MKKIFLSKVYVIFIILCMSSINIFAKTVPNVFFNGELKNIKIIFNDCNTLIPLRFCSEELKAIVNWDKVTQEITIKKGTDKILFKIASLKYNCNGELKELLVAPKQINGTTYVPFRPLIEALNGVVLYNNEYKFINIYDTNSEAYKVYKALNSTDITEKRFAMLELPKKSFQDCYGGSRGNTYIFPVGKSSNYFFRYFSDEGIFYGMDYFEVHDGIAVQKWSRTQNGSTPVSLTQSPLLNYIGKGIEIKEKGKFPSISETSFVGFYNNTFESSKDTIANISTIGNTVSFINEKGFSRPNSSISSELIFSPFGSWYYLMTFEE